MAIARAKETPRVTTATTMAVSIKVCGSGLKYRSVFSTPILLSRTVTHELFLYAMTSQNIMVDI
jgi:hypothetical protein